MSLVSCAVGKTLWNLRTTDMEEVMRQIGEKLHGVSQRIQGITDERSFVDQQINNIYQRASTYRNAAYNAQMSGDPRASSVVNNARRALSQLRQTHQQLKQRKKSIELTVKNLHAEERSIQKHKDTMETQLKLAQAFGPMFGKMEGKAIKRFTYNG